MRPTSFVALCLVAFTTMGTSAGFHQRYYDYYPPNPPVAYSQAYNRHPDNGFFQNSAIKRHFQNLWGRQQDYDIPASNYDRYPQNFGQNHQQNQGSIPKMRSESFTRNTPKQNENLITVSLDTTTMRAPVKSPSESQEISSPKSVTLETEQSLHQKSTLADDSMLLTEAVTDDNQRRRKREFNAKHHNSGEERQKRGTKRKHLSEHHHQEKPISESRHRQQKSETVMESVNTNRDVDKRKVHKIITEVVKKHSQQDSQNKNRNEELNKVITEARNYYNGEQFITSEDYSDYLNEYIPISLIEKFGDDDTDNLQDFDKRIKTSKGGVSEEVMGNESRFVHKGLDQKRQDENIFHIPITESKDYSVEADLYDEDGYLDFGSDVNQSPVATEQTINTIPTLSNSVLKESLTATVAVQNNSKHLQSDKVNTVTITDTMIAQPSTITITPELTSTDLDSESDTISSESPFTSTATQPDLVIRDPGLKTAVAQTDATVHEATKNEPKSATTFAAVQQNLVTLEQANIVTIQPESVFTHDSIRSSLNTYEIDTTASVFTVTAAQSNLATTVPTEQPDSSTAPSVKSNTVISDATDKVQNAQSGQDFNATSIPPDSNEPELASTNVAVRFERVLAESTSTPSGWTKPTHSELTTSTTQDNLISTYLVTKVSAPSYTASLESITRATETEPQQVTPELTETIPGIPSASVLPQSATIPTTAQPNPTILELATAATDASSDSVSLKSATTAETTTPTNRKITTTVAFSKHETVATETITTTVVAESDSQLVTKATTAQPDPITNEPATTAAAALSERNTNEVAITAVDASSYLLSSKSAKTTEATESIQLTPKITTNVASANYETVVIKSTTTTEAASSDLVSPESAITATGAQLKPTTNKLATLAIDDSSNSLSFGSATTTEDLYPIRIKTAKTTTTAAFEYHESAASESTTTTAAKSDLFSPESAITVAATQTEKITNELAINATEVSSESVFLEADTTTEGIHQVSITTANTTPTIASVQYETSAAETTTPTAAAVSDSILPESVITTSTEYFEPKTLELAAAADAAFGSVASDSTTAPESTQPIRTAPETFVSAVVEKSNSALLDSAPSSEITQNISIFRESVQTTTFESTNSNATTQSNSVPLELATFAIAAQSNSIPTESTTTTDVPFETTTTVSTQKDFISATTVRAEQSDLVTIKSTRIAEVGSIDAITTELPNSITNEIVSTKKSSEVSTEETISSASIQLSHNQESPEQHEQTTQTFTLATEPTSTSEQSTQISIKQLALETATPTFLDNIVNEHTPVSEEQVSTEKSDKTDSEPSITTSMEQIVTEPSIELTQKSTQADVATEAIKVSNQTLNQGRTIQAFEVEETSPSSEDPIIEKKTSELPLFEVGSTTPLTENKRKGRYDLSKTNSRREIEKAIETNINFKTLIVPDKSRPGGKCYCSCELNSKPLFISFDPNEINKLS